MSSPQLRTLPEFNPADPNTTAKEWEVYKRPFLVHLDALGLDEKPGKRKVGVLLANMGNEAIKIYDSFTRAPRVEGNADNNIPDVPAEDKHDLDTVFKKFDTHFGVHNYRNIKRQEFLNTKRGNKSIMDYITELKKKAEYGDQREGLICDMIINGVNDRKCTAKLMEIPATQLTLDKVIQTCRQVELTKAHIDTLDAENPHVNYVKPKQKVGYQGTHPYCDKCTKHHALRTCPAFNKQCNICGMRGHFKASPICKGSQHAPRSSRFPWRGTSGRGSFSRGYNHSRSRGRSGYRLNVHFTESVDTVDVAQPDTHDDMHVGEMFDQCSIHDIYAADSNVLNDTSRSSSDSDWSVTFDVKGINLTLEIDTGARCNVIAKSIAEKFTAIAPIRKANNYINGISGHLVEPVGQIILPCRHNGKLMNLMFQILDTERPICLLGRPDSVRYNLVTRVNSVTSCIEDLIGSFSDVVGEEIGCLPGEYEIKVDSSVQPVVHAPRPVPVAMRDQVKRELDNLVRCGIIASVTEPTEWVSSMVCVRKKNGRVRICLDPTDLNKAVLREHFPMYSIEDIVTRVHGSKVFSTLDANMGYFQIRLTQKSSMLTTFNTLFGRYRYLRMPMGLKCAAEVFQREMINHFGGIEGVEVVIDDILIHGANMEQHNARLRTVLQKARSINLKLNKAKCVIGKPEVNYVGHLLTGDGLKPTSERVRAITEMRVPENHAELETILGMLAYVAKLIPKLSELNAPLRAIEFAPLARNLTSRHVIQHVKDNIARYGIMDTLVSDNGPQFASAEFKSFAQTYGFEIITSSSLYPKSNGLAKKSVQTVKNLIKKCSDSGDDIYLALLDLSNTPRDDEMGSPMQRLMGRRAKTRLPISENLRKPSSINPSVVSNRLMDYRQKQKFYYDQNAKERAQCREGDSVRIHTPDGWKPAEYIKQSSEPRSHIVKAGSSGRLYRRNNSMLLKTREDPHIIQEHKEGGNKVVSPEAQSVQPKFAPPQPQSVVTKPAQYENVHIPKDPSDYHSFWQSHSQTVVSF